MLHGMQTCMMQSACDFEDARWPLLAIGTTLVRQRGDMYVTVSYFVHACKAYIVLKPNYHLPLFDTALDNNF